MSRCGAALPLLCTPTDRTKSLTTMSLSSEIFKGLRRGGCYFLCRDWLDTKTYFDSTHVYAAGAVHSHHSAFFPKLSRRISGGRLSALPAAGAGALQRRQGRVSRATAWRGRRMGPPGKVRVPGARLPGAGAVFF